MAITLHTAGSWAFDSSGSITVTLPTHSTGDMLLVRVAIKSGAIATCVASTATPGWNKLGQFAGATNSGNGTGSVLVAVFWKEAASAAEGNPTIDFDQTNTQGGVVAMSYQKAAGELWTTPVGDGGLDEGTANTSHSATIQSHVSATVGDLIDFFTGIRDDTTMTVPTFTQAGATLDAVTESPATAGIDTGGADGAYDGGFRKVTAGTSSAAAVVTSTLSTAETGTSWTTRLRVSVATDAPAEVAPATAAANAVTTTIQTNADVASATAAGNQAAPGVSPNADVAAVTATANAVTTTIETNAGVAAATGTASQPAAEVSPSAGSAPALAAALDATVQTTIGTDADAEVASVVATANQSAAGVSPNAEAAAAIAAAYSPDASLLVNTGTAQATAGAYDATVSTATFVDANAEAAAAIAAAYGMDATVAPTAGRGSVAATARDASTTSTGPVNVNAGLASASATAYGATVKQPTKRQIQRFQRVNAYARLAQATARVPDATVEWNDDEAAIALLI